MRVQISVSQERLRAFCQKWKITELSLFGSVLTDEFRPDSDVDVLIVYADEAKPDLWDHLHAQEELAGIVGREVDLVEKRALRNPFRRHDILSNREVIYAA
jgi:predicted nucleotidyltransferase